MLLTTDGIVLHNTKYRDTSLISRIFTRELGLVTYIINGVRSSKKSNAASVFQPLNQLELVVYQNDNKSLQRIKDFKLKHLYSSINNHSYKSLEALFLLELMNKTIKEEEQNQGLYTFIEQNLLKMDSSDYDPNFHLHFALQLSRFLGFFPHNNYDALNTSFDLHEGVFCVKTSDNHRFIGPPVSAHIEKLIRSTPDLNIKREERKQLLHAILSYYKIHQEGFGEMKSLKVIETLFQ